MAERRAGVVTVKSLRIMPPASLLLYSQAIIVVPERLIHIRATYTIIIILYVWSL
jgi:hypothetical protein